MKKSFSIEGSERLSKSEMKKIVGAGSLNSAPAAPQGKYNLVMTDGGCLGSMCCWEDYPEDCSGCTNGFTPDQGYCPDSGAFIAACNC